MRRGSWEEVRVSSIDIYYLSSADQTNQDRYDTCKQERMSAMRRIRSIGLTCQLVYPFGVVDATALPCHGQSLGFANLFEVR